MSYPTRFEDSVFEDAAVHLGCYSTALKHFSFVENAPAVSAALGTPALIAFAEACSPKFECHAPPPAGWRARICVESRAAIAV